MNLLILFVHILLCVYTAEGGVLIPNRVDYIPPQEELDRNCTERCPVDFCLISDQTDCRRFITCKRNTIFGLGTNNYRGTLQLCAFGTHWAGSQQHLTCDQLQNVKCGIDKCAGRPLGSNYTHLVDNCKTYWRCGDKGPEAKCCPVGYYFDKMELRCMVDTDPNKMCKDACPIKKDVCRSTPVKDTEYFDDRNCRTYWNCTDNRPHPTCCPDGEGYEPLSGRCEKNGCSKSCPDEYQPDICLKQGIPSYELHDTHCRTYMECGPGGVEKPACCLSDSYYNPDKRMCEEKIGAMLGCDDICPYPGNSQCPLEPGPTADTFMMGGHLMNCSGITVFSLKDCSCQNIKNDDTVIPSCNIELDIIFDITGLKRAGTQKVKVTPLGLMLPGVGYGQQIPQTVKFDGNNRYRIMYFRQPFPKLYTDLIYRPDNAAFGGRRILLSNCMNRDQGAPSYEVYLQNGTVNLIMVTHATKEQVPDQEMLSLRYQPEAWNRLRIIYDGSRVQMLNQVLDQNSNIPSEVASADLQGKVLTAAEGMDIGQCQIHPDNSVLGFIGSLAQLQFTKYPCQQLIDSFNDGARNAVVVGASSGGLPPV